MLWIGLLVARDLWDKAEKEYMTGQGKPYSIVKRPIVLISVTNLMQDGQVSSSAI